ncbi:hypothetical protein CsSME_00046857 [Camellia sinensis var. sinensis]
MKGKFQVVHGVDLIQPQEQWDYTNLGYTGINSNPSLRSAVQNNCNTNLEKNELSMWVEHVTKQLIEDLPESGTDESFQTDTTMVYDEDNTALRPAKTTGTRSHFDGAGDQLQWCNYFGDQTKFTEINGGGSKGLSRFDEHGLSLLTLLLECAVAISVDNLGEAHRMLLELTQMASPYGPSCAERVVSCFSKAMACRLRW